MDRNGHERTRMHLNVGFESPGHGVDMKKGPLAGPFFKFLLAESWGCPGLLRKPARCGGLAASLRASYKR